MSGSGAAGMTAARPAVAQAAAAAVEARARIAERHAAGGDGWAVVVLASERFDAIVRDVWGAILGDLPAAAADRVRASVTLVAHGGFGRSEMAPWL